ncbi:condensation domain-containing protein [Pedobacter sp. R20-19]|uniref:condensation domain-containing protein n=1 Tax=Pedobacter sp. R20-19 TaxID=1270196 RepID=UPI0004938C78|nr:condensation domain-containing protein [Pedobacter sp. R20-19]
MLKIDSCGPITFQQKQSYDYHMSLTDLNSSEIMLLNLDVSDLNPVYLPLTINRLFKDIDSFRTVFASENGDVFQKILKFDDLDDFYFDSLDKSDEKYNEAVADELIAMVSSAMGLRGNSPLCKCLIVNFEGGIRRCMFFIHHIIVDLWSILIIKNKFYELYNSYVSNQNYPDALAGRSYNMIDYAKEQKEAYHLNGQSAIAYWNNKLAPIFKDRSTSFTDITGQKVLKFNDESGVNSVLDHSECGFIALKVQGKRLEIIYQILKESNTSFMALFNVVFSLLPWYHGASKDVLIASPVNNRLNSRLKYVVGLCGGSIYTYLHMKPELTVSKILKDAYIDILRSFKYAITEHTVYELDGRHLREKCDLFLNITAKEFENKIPENYYRGEGFEGKRTYYALQCSIHEQKDHISMIWGHNKSIYTQGQVEHLVASVFNLLELVKARMDKPLTNLYTSKKSH